MHRKSDAGGDSRQHRQYSSDVPPVPPDGRSADERPSWRRWPLLPLAVLLGSLIIFAALSVASWMLYDRAEQQLLEERTGEAGQVLTVAVGDIQAPVEAAATIAEVTNGNPDAFKASMADQVGAAAPARYTSAVQYRIADVQPVASLGEPVDLPADGPTSVAGIADHAAANGFVVVDLINSGRRLGYAAVDNQDAPEFLVYAERLLNPDPNVRTRTDEPFAHLDYAIYLNSEQPEQLISSSLPSDELPIDGRRESTSSPFGDQQLVLVMTPIGQLSGWLFANLWWIVGIAGVLLSTGAALLTRSLHQRREEALTLARDNARLYDEQRHIAETLQLSLLPQVLVPPPGGHVTARYWPAGEASLIGGDFYDAFRVDADRWAVVIGDVCGKGIDAAAITGLVRHTVRAAARNATSAAEVLRDVHRALSDHQPSTFCTVCFFYVNVAEDGSQSLMLSLGGHPSPVLRRADGAVREIGEPGSLLGIFEPVLFDTTVPVAPGDTLVLYTDGLTDAPPNQAVPIDELLELLSGQAGDEPVELLADSIRPLKRRRRPRGSADDTAIVVLRFGVPAEGGDSAPRESAGIGATAQA
jgi:serine phosphatase RsbU (regulator of sigma subunit)